MRKKERDLEESMVAKNYCYLYQTAIDNNNIQKVRSLLRSCPPKNILFNDPYPQLSVLDYSILKKSQKIALLFLKDGRVKPSTKSISHSAEYGLLQVFKALSRNRRLDPSCNDNYAIRYACANGHDEIVRILLKHPKVDPADKNNYCIRWACSSGRVGVVKILLADSRVDPSVNHNESIRYASSNGHVRILEELLKDDRCNPSDNNNEPIRWAAENGNIEIVRLLLNDKRVDPSTLNNWAIVRVAENGHFDIMKLLLADTRIDPSGNMNAAIIKSCQNGYINVIRLLLSDNRVDPADQNNKAIRMAADNGHNEVIIELLKDKRVNPADERNQALILAARNGHIETLKLLLSDSRVDPSDRKNQALLSAAKRGHHLIVKELMKDKRVIPSDNQNTAIKKASYALHLDVVKELLNDDDVIPGDNVVKWALFNNYIKLIKLLLVKKQVIEFVIVNLVDIVQHSLSSDKVDIIKLLLSDNNVCADMDLDGLVGIKKFQELLKDEKFVAEASGVLKRRLDMASSGLKFEGNIFSENGNGNIYKSKLSLRGFQKYYIYCGEFKYGLKHGIGRLFYPNTNIIEYYGEFVDDKMHGIGRRYAKKSGEILKGIWKLGKFSKSTDSNIQVQELSVDLIERIKDEIFSLSYVEMAKVVIGKGSYGTVYRLVLNFFKINIFKGEKYAFKHFDR